MYVYIYGQFFEILKISPMNCFKSFVLRIVNIFLKREKKIIARPTQVCFLLSFRN